MTGKRRPKIVTVALAGAPNTGKSTVFNALTGLRQHVGNWPGKTVEKKSGICRRDGKVFSIVDLPGSYGLGAHSTEEEIARDFLALERPDVVIAIIDASSLERNLYLVCELLQLRAGDSLGQRWSQSLARCCLTAADGVLAPHSVTTSLRAPGILLRHFSHSGVCASCGGRSEG